jgi:hypothetical protein
MAQHAVFHIERRVLQRLCQLYRAFAVVLQQMKCHALGRFHTDPRQAAQGLYQQFKRVNFGHGFFLGAPSGTSWRNKPPLEMAQRAK